MPKRTTNHLRVGIVTTSYPMPGDSCNGIFVERMVRNLPESINSLIIVPAGLQKEPPNDIHGQYRLVSFRYAPWRYQVLARQSGGIPAALQSNKLLYLLIPLFLLAMAWACLRSARHVDLFNANWSITGFIAGMVGYVTDTPVITTLRGEDVTRASSSKIYFWLLKTAIRLSNKVVVVSDAIKTTVSTWFPDEKDKIIMIPNGVDEQLLKIERDYVSRKGSSTRLLTISALIRRKAVNRIIEAMAAVRCDPQPLLTIVGDGPESENLKNLVAHLNLEDRVTFTGFSDPDAVPHYLAVADIFILASYSEGRPNVILEAMASGMAIISSRIDGVIELVKEDERGLLFEPDNTDELARKIENLAQEPILMQEMGNAARKFIIDKGLLWRNTGEYYAALYQQCVGHGKQKVQK